MEFSANYTVMKEIKLSSVSENDRRFIQEYMKLDKFVFISRNLT